MADSASPTLRQRIKYPFPPIQEAVCEIHFNLPGPLDKETIKGMGKNWQSNYPKQNIAIEQHLKVNLSVEKVDASRTDVGHKLIARSSDEKNLAQLGPRFMAVNRLKPYPGWEEGFRDMILTRFEEVKAFLGFETIGRIGLRYINLIPFQQRPLEWQEWLTVTPPVPSGLRESGGEFQCHYRRLVDRDLECRINLGTVPADDDNVTAVMLDIDVILQRTLRATEVAAGLETVHNPHRELFEGYLLDKTRQLFHTGK